MGNVTVLDSSRAAYLPAAIYYQESDSLEYVRRDAPAVYRRVDELLTLVLEMESRDLLGFRIKGFRNFYLRYLQKKYDLRENDFVRLVNVIQDAMQVFGSEFFEEKERVTSYERAISLAEQDDVRLNEFPIAS